MCNPTTLRDLVEAINRSGFGTVFVIDNDKVLRAAVTDGDVRRALLSGHGLESPASTALNEHFVFLAKDDRALSSEARQTGANRGLTELPIIDSLGRLIGVEKQKARLASQTRPNAVALMAGGQGLRLRPLTEDTPKPMLPVGGKPILEHIIDDLRREGFIKIFLAVNYLAEKIEDHFEDGSPFGVQIEYIREDQPLGTAGPLSLIGSPGLSPMVVMNADLMVGVSFAAMVDYHVEKAAAITVGAKVVETTSPFGVLSTNGAVVTSMAEKPKRVDLVNAGVYVISPEVVASLPHGEPQDMPDLITAHVPSGNVVAFPIHEMWADLGRVEDLRRVQDEWG